MLDNNFFLFEEMARSRRLPAFVRIARAASGEGNKITNTGGSACVLITERAEMSNIFTIFNKIADERIREAMDRGEFDDLPGKGKPLDLEDDSHLPQDIRFAYKILKNANCLPPELELRKEIHKTEDLLAGIKDTQEKYKQIKKLNYLVMKLNMSRHVSLVFEENQRYFEKLVDKMGSKKES